MVSTTTRVVPVFPLHSAHSNVCWDKSEIEYWHGKLPLEQFVARAMQGFLREIDPNWYRLHFVFQNGFHPVFLPENTRTRSLGDLCAIESCILNGPRYGSVVIPREVVERLIPLRELMLIALNFNSISNPDFVLELLDERTRIIFENTQTGIVRSFDPKDQSFFVHHEIPTSLSWPKWGVVERYTMQQLKQELLMDGMHNCQACALEYLPPKGHTPPVFELAGEKTCVKIAS